MSFETEGLVHKIFDAENKTDTFRTREFVIKLDGQYPQFIKFQLTQDRCDIVNDYKEGDHIKVHFDLRGREWNEKYFTNLNAWKVEKVSSEQTAPNPNDGAFEAIQEPSFEVSGDSGSNMPNAEDFDDLPF